KAHREVSNLLLQILDEGHLTDSQGRKVDFRNTIIIMTSNIGAEQLASLPEGIDPSDIQEQIMRQLRQKFSPEFINRIDDIILFNRLTRKNLDAIIDIQMGYVAERLKEN